ncbi:MAG TPA: polyprenyl synthetase family protein [Saprospiraceae bacterium]|nr:polyprenyl synthetase family protein [Saprospiraceae bacterium]
MMQNFDEIQLLFQQYLDEQIFRQEPQSLYEPVNYIMQVGGKRLRPALALMACQMFGAPASRALPAAYAIEIFHNFSLVHDDIMDQAPLRRGQPTVHQRFGLNAGILSGDVMLIYAYAYLLKTAAPDCLPQLLNCFNRVAIEVCEGQQMDMDFEQRETVSIDAYLKMIELKTAALIGGALELGAIIGGATLPQAAQLATFGRNAGIAFQLQDDWLDAFGNPTIVGKKQGGDIAQNKKTYLIIKALEIADDATRQELCHWLATTDQEAEKIERVIHLLQQLDIPKHAESIKTNYMRQAYDALEQLPGDATVKTAIAELADKLANRAF